MSQFEKCKKFLELNEYETGEINEDYTSMHHNDGVCLDLSENEIVFIGEDGDFLHIPCDYYALIGALIHLKAITLEYNHE